ncbi:FadR/GntR family transcriptional regulator [Pseudoteredinibacter isoporae]|uniref:DNA-binding FadR family transcriptional regulator n=1 Tax=Pseudoteredinibacter isoporae TaxID=570281 RepID=A0A7X0MWC2_9GAMM|nr:FadR/GntR family transcriptional regulator [Pseudoteredinibacter isoporae]MBB6522571.1 DNA-binding FadR family transcriptional regulator [Pseudoteredinibacter isoporae]NHO88101.1 FadR family transcriptional regulator [Pseudoteredinibacter isoporae]NIB23568.1 FadR family transcriptional regulator [Pseudoteredinibacter isoporae]
MDKNRNLTQQMVYDLGKSIVSGQYGVGDGLPSEAELCENFGVSRSATREAVKMLTAKGLLSSRPRQGIRVMPEAQWNMFDRDVLDWILSSKPSLQLLREFTQMRLAIEPEAAALVADLGQEAPLISAALERMEDAEAGLDDALESDIDFHISVLLSSRNRFLMQFKPFVETALRVSIRYTNQIKGVSIADISAHRKIYQAIKSGDANLARRRTRAIINEVLELIDNNLDE